MRADYYREHIQHATGVAKAGYSTAQAAEREALRMARVKEQPFDFYLCRVCAKWHVGTKRRYRQRQVLWYELGGRVTSQFAKENIGSASKRRKSIRENCREALRRANTQARLT